MLLPVQRRVKIHFSNALDRDEHRFDSIQALSVPTGVRVGFAFEAAIAETSERQSVISSIPSEKSWPRSP